MRAIPLYRVFWILVAGVLSAQPLYAEESLIETLLTSSEAVVEVQSSVVQIAAAGRGPFSTRERQRNFMSRRLRHVRTTQRGAGVILDSDLRILVTSAHLVKRNSQISIRLQNGLTFEGQLIHRVSEKDLAYIHIRKPEDRSTFPELMALELAGTALNAQVYTIGSSPITHNTLSEGRITGLGHAIQHPYARAQVEVLRVDFNIYQGDSGSPLLDREGRLLGIMAAARIKASKIAFAIPASTIQKHLQLAMQRVKVV